MSLVNIAVIIVLFRKLHPMPKKVRVFVIYRGVQITRQMYGTCNNSVLIVGFNCYLTKCRNYDQTVRNDWTKAIRKVTAKIKRKSVINHGFKCNR